jgi:hypothetical protein
MLAVSTQTSKFKMVLIWTILNAQVLRFDTWTILNAQDYKGHEFHNIVETTAKN